MVWLGIMVGAFGGPRHAGCRNRTRDGYGRRGRRIDNVFGTG